MACAGSDPPKADVPSPPPATQPKSPPCTITQHVSKRSNTCLKGYVWREASPTDYVCVLPWVKQQAKLDNEQAAKRRVLSGYRVTPMGSPYALSTCKQGFVRRQAYPGDDVCVTPATRAQVVQDNNMAKSRTESSEAVYTAACGQ